MELFHKIANFLLQVAILSGLLWVFIRNVLSDGAPSFLQHHVLLFSLLSSFTLQLIYNLLIWPYFLDPLRNLPGAFVTDFREFSPITNAPRGKRTLELVKQFPGVDVIYIRNRLGWNVLLPVSPQAHRDVLNGKNGDFEKPEGGVYFLARLVGYGLILQKGAVHKHQRKAVTPSFRIQNIKALQPLVAAKTALMLQRVQEEMQTMGKIEIASWGSRLTMDIIGPALMSKDFQSLTTQNSPLEHAYAELIAPSQGQASIFQWGLLLPPWIVRRIPTTTNRMITKNGDFIRTTCGSILDEKMSTLKAGVDIEEEGTSDILGNIMGKTELSRSELIDHMMTFLGAGHETTASSIAWATHLLTLPEYFHYQAILRKEIQDAMLARTEDTDPTEGILSYATLESLPYLNGICEETLRLFPPVTNTARKAQRNTTIAGLPIPKGKMIVLFPWAINRNPEFWGANADKMVPERWIESLPDGNTRVNKSGGASSNMCEQTFLHGNRSCIGRDFAKAELRYVLAAMFAGFELKRLPDDDGTVVPAGSLTIKPKGGLYVTVTPVGA